MKIKCPHCEKDFDAHVSTEMMDEQTLYFVITYTGDLLQAKTVWDVIKNFEILMKESAKAQGQKVNVWIKDITNNDGKLTIQFVVTAIK